MLMIEEEVSELDRKIEELYDEYLEKYTDLLSSNVSPLSNREKEDMINKFERSYILIEYYYLQNFKNNEEDIFLSNLYLKLEELREYHYSVFKEGVKSTTILWEDE